MKVRNIIVAGLSIGLIAAAPSADQASANRIHADVQFLASDWLEGRDTGSRGHEIASEYVASQFLAIGLKPGGTDGSWMVRVPFRRASNSGDQTLTMTTAGKTSTLRYGVDFAAAPSLSTAERAIDAPLVFVGQGIRDRRSGIDDYRGLDARGKIVVYLAGTPDTLTSDVAAHLRSSKVRFAMEAGAVGVIEIPVNAKAGPTPKRAMHPIVNWVDKTGNPDEPGVRITLSADQQARLFEGSGKSLAKLLSAKSPPKGFPLKVSMSFKGTSKFEDFTSPVVVGRLDGSDAALSSEYVVLMGHLDHLGMDHDGKPGEDLIYNGALDNAAGVATMIEAARRFASAPDRPKRSLLFIASTGEEEGLLGADYFARHPTVPQSAITAAVDLDMPLLLYPFTDVVAFGADHSTIGQAVADAGREMGIALSPDPMAKEAIFVRSDHYRFVQRGIPAVLLMTGHANGGAAFWKSFLGGTYHSPKDDLTQKIDWNAGARYAELNYRIARTLADAPQRAQWIKGDYFGDLYGQQTQR